MDWVEPESLWLFELDFATAVLGSLPAAKPTFQLWLGQGLPIWLSRMVSALFALAALGGLASLITGRAAAESIVDDLAASLIKFLTLPVLLPLRSLQCLFQGDR